VDGRSQDRFLAALAPGAVVRPVRLLLADDSAIWRERHEPRATLVELDAVLGGARERLALDDSQYRWLRRRVATRLLDIARGNPWNRDALLISRRAARSLPPWDRRAALARYAGALAVSPARRAAGAAARSTRALPGISALRKPAKQSRLARRIYGKLVGSE
jgi:hypothetical protein